MKFLPHDLKQVKYKILQLYSTKNILLFFWMNVGKTAILSGFWQKNGLGPLGIKSNSKQKLCGTKSFQIKSGKINPQTPLRTFCNLHMTSRV